MSCITSVDGIKTLVIELIGHLSRDVIGRLYVKQWCYWLWRLVMSLVRFDPSVSELNSSLLLVKIVGCPAILS